MLSLEERIALMHKLGTHLKSDDPGIQQAITQAYLHNKWFTVENIRKAINAIVETMLQAEALKDWAGQYHIPETTDAKTIGLVMAGNLPLVGFHDFLSVFISGHKAQIKLSEKDSKLPMAVFDFLNKTEPRFKDHVELVIMLKNFDAVIATGSNNTARYFESYFGKYPNIIRKNRTSVAVLNGSESPDEIRSLGIDIFEYFGLGCRNVSKIYLPEGYEMEPLLEILHEFNQISVHNKYQNNYDYNLTLYILNKISYLSNGCLIMVENPELHSRIACIHYEFYKNEADLDLKLKSVKDQIQVVVSQHPKSGFTNCGFGKAQKPGLQDYADQIDTMHFLSTFSTEAMA